VKTQIIRCAKTIKTRSSC